MSTSKDSILLVTNIFPPEIGGPSTFIPHLAEALSADGHRVSVICYSSVKPVLSDKSKPYHIVRVSRGLPPYFREVIFLLRLFWLFFRHDKAYCNGEIAFAGLCAKLTRTPCAAKIVGDPLWETRRNQNQTSLELDEFSKKEQSLSKLEHFMFRGFVNQIDKIVVPSQYLRQVVANWSKSDSKIEVILNGFCMEEKNTEEHDYGVSDQLKLLFVGRLTNWKGVDLILLAMLEVPEATLTIVGDGPELTMLKDLSERCGLSERVVFLGRCDKNKVEAEMISADVLILPSLYEGLSHTLLEAGVLGLPVIASARGGNLELVEHDVDGLLVDPKSTTSMVQQLQKMSIVAERERLGRAYKKKITEGFDFEQTVKETQAMLEQLR